MDYVDAQWHSMLFVVVCDLGNDLTPDGQVCFDDAVAKATTCEDWRDWAIESGDDITPHPPSLKPHPSRPLPPLSR